ncbi:MAG: hypothetical protein FJ125_09720, partial [Deltaproteobacteria bacterium]|nr:hypothetical protein [Deltaproteobacteria bacterium]
MRSPAGPSSGSPPGPAGRSSRSTRRSWCPGRWASAGGGGDPLDDHRAALAEHAARSDDPRRAARRPARSGRDRAAALLGAVRAGGSAPGPSRPAGRGLGAHLLGSAPPARPAPPLRQPGAGRCGRAAAPGRPLAQLSAAPAGDPAQGPGLLRLLPRSRGAAAGRGVRRRRSMTAAPPLDVRDGQAMRAAHQAEHDYVVVGSGPAGAAVARLLARSGASVAVVEEGPWVRPHELPADGFSAMALLYREMGSSLIGGRAPMPCLQGRAVGGGSLINGAISWRLPRDVHEEWLRADPALEEALPWDELEEVQDRVEAELHIAPTAPEVAGPNNLLLARGAQALGIAHRPILRNVAGCTGLGRCLQGCPRGAKQSMDLTYLAEACAGGAQIIASTRVWGVRVEHGRARAVEAVAAAGGRVELGARHGVVLAASALQTPEILLRSRIGHGPVGENLQGHPGASLVGHFPEPVRMWRGATQGHEAIGLRHEGIKFEALGYDMGVVAMRAKGVGRGLARDIGELAHWCNWGAAVRAAGRGRVRAGRRGAAARFTFVPADLLKLRRGLR